MNILLIDDHQDLTDIMKKLLEKSGYDVTTANRCALGVQLLHSQNFDVVITNIGLSDCEEHCVIDLLEKTGKIKDTYVMVLSEKLTHNEMSALKKRGVMACYEKPVSPDVILLTLASL